MLHRSLLFGLVLAFWCTASLFPACTSTDDGRRTVDWPAVTRELDLGAADLRDVALLVDEDAAGRMRSLADVLERAAQELSAAGPSADTLDALDAALDTAQGILDGLPSNAHDEARAAVLILRAGLRRVRAYVYASSLDADGMEPAR